MYGCTAAAASPEPWLCDAAPAPDFHHLLPGQVVTGESAEPRSFSVLLVNCAQRVVHRDAFDGVEPHGFLSGSLHREGHGLLPVWHRLKGHVVRTVVAA